MTLSAGTHLGPYEILSTLGAGGMGEVYRAHDSRLDRNVAIKVLSEALANDSHALARFETEAKAVAALSHPNILAIHDFGRDGGVTYAVTELLEGESLRAVLLRGALDLRRALALAEQVAKALAAAHEKGIVHRDVNRKTCSFRKTATPSSWTSASPVKPLSSPIPATRTLRPVPSSRKRAPSSAPCTTCRPSRRAGGRSTIARISSRSGSSCTRCWRAGDRSMETRSPRR